VSGHRRLKLFALCALLVGAGPLALSFWHGPAGGCVPTPEGRALAALKNREAEPWPEDFDRSVTLSALLAPGDERGRWSETRAAAVEGYVVSVTEARVEAANCFWPTRRDVHIDLAASPDAPPAARVVTEVTPRWRERAAARGLDWSADALRRTLVGRRCRVEGWLLLDRQHAEESESVSPGRPGNWRGTAWELHPVTSITIAE
jgi:hypothetical protein